MSKMIQENDYVVPVFDDGDDFQALWTPCRVIRIYQNGRLWARSDDGHTSHRGAVSAFRLAP